MKRVPVAEMTYKGH